VKRLAFAIDGKAEALATKRNHSAVFAVSLSSLTRWSRRADGKSKTNA
jgi:hypothetical protein